MIRMAKWLLIIFIILGAYYYISTGHKSYLGKRQTEQKSYTERDHILNKLFNKVDEYVQKDTAKKLNITKNIKIIKDNYKAIDFNTIIKNNKIDFSKPIYTLSLQKAFLNLQGKPLLFYSYLIDYSKKGQQYLLIFYDFGSKGPKFRYELECGEEQTKNIIEVPRDSRGDEYAVVAIITDIRRPKFSVRAFGVGENEAEIEVEPSDIYIARGRCLDLVYIGGELTKKELP